MADIFDERIKRERSVEEARVKLAGLTGEEYQAQWRSWYDAAEDNDPRSPQLTTADVTAHPVYIRLEESGTEPAWAVEGVTVVINPGSSSTLRYLPLPSPSQR
ncbi:hypothetical protein ABZY36_32050 [Streptomyces sp. NPDC006627]|uniref:hypothetical protein n=1 Tax=Streptomyces sp. NPDC006627 TaxID=3154679 RepID=UPI00339E059F